MHLFTRGKCNGPWFDGVISIVERVKGVAVVLDRCALCDCRHVGVVKDELWFHWAKVFGAEVLAERVFGGALVHKINYILGSWE
jgi:hypothetical protein